MAGTYTVTISGSSATADGLTLGGSSGTQTVAIDATDNCSGAANSSLTLPAGGTVGADGKIELSQTTTSDCGEGTPELEVSGGTLSSAGTIETDLGPDQTNGSYPAYIDGTIVNTGAIKLNAISDFGQAISNSSLDNKGSVTLGNGDNWNTFNAASVTDDAGGSISNGGGTGALTMSGGTYIQGAGTTSPSTANPSQPAVLLNSTAVSYTGTGASSVVLRGSAALSGNLASGQNLTIQATDFCSGASNAEATAAASFTNAGDIELTQTTGSGHCGEGTPLLEVSAGTLTNSGTIETDLGPSQTNGSYPPYLDGTVVNTGTITLNETTDLGEAISNSSLDNKGTLTMSATTNSTLDTFNNATVTDDTGGIITNQGGTGGLVMSGGTYNQGAGTTNLATTIDPADPAVLLNSTALKYTGTGASSLVFRGNATLSGSLASAQNLAVQATDFCSGASNAEATAAASFTNAGDVDLTQAGTCGDGTPLLEVSSGTLTNSGKIQTNLGPNQTNGSYPAYLDGAFTNTGTIAISDNSYLGEAISNSSLDNEGTLSVGGSDTLTTENAATVTDDTGGSITNASGSGELVVNGGTYDQGDGTTSPSSLDPTDPAVLLQSAALHYTGTGASSIVARGNFALSGNLAAAQDLTVQATDLCSGATNADAEVASSLTNAGTIQLTQTGGCSNGTPYLEVASPAVLTNSGTIRTDKGTNETASAQLDGAFVNTGTIAINAVSLLGNNESNSSLDNKGALSLATGETLTTANNASVIDDTGGSISNGTGTGELVMTAGTYSQGAGSISQTDPVPANSAVLLNSTTLKYTGKGKGTIVARGSFSETGNLAKGQDLVVQGTDFCSGATDADMTPTKKLTNAAVITFAHAGSCSSDSVFITLGSGIKLTNTGTISATSPRPEEITGGTLTSTGTVSVNAGDTLEVTGTLSNVSAAGVLKGGIYTLAGTFEYDNSTFATTGMTSNDATMTLSGSGEFTDGNGANALRNLATNAKKLTLSGGDGVSTSKSLTNSGTVSLGGGSTLNVAGAFTQSGTKSALTVTLASATSYGQVVATGASTLTGTLTIDQTYDASASTSESILSSSARTGTFTKVTVKNTGGKGSATPAASYTATGVTVTG